MAIIGIMPLEQEKGVLTMTKIEGEHRAHEWASRIEAFRASGMTQRRWAAEQGLSEDRVSYWYRKLGRPPESLVVLGLTLFDRPGLMIAGRAEPRQNPDREDPGFVRVRPHQARVG
jgi:hypothetical protein